VRIDWGAAVSVMVGVLFGVAAIVALVRRKGSLAWYLGAGWYVLWFPIHLWFWQFTLTGPAPVGSSYILEAVFQIAVPIVWLIWSCFHRFKPVRTAIVLICLFSLVLQLFSFIYWSYGSTRNFSISLSHLDSFYFALGTLTTAGTGNVSAISETARGLQTLQMGLDLLFVGIALTVVLARYSTLFSRRQAELPHDAAMTAPLAPVLGEREQSQRASVPDHPCSACPMDKHKEPQETADTKPPLDPAHYPVRRDDGEAIEQ
jgi:Ion channel